MEVECCGKFQYGKKLVCGGIGGQNEQFLERINHPWPKVHLIRVMRRHDLTEKDLPTNLRKHPQGAILDI